MDILPAVLACWTYYFAGLLYCLERVYVLWDTWWLPVSVVGILLLCLTLYAAMSTSSMLRMPNVAVSPQPPTVRFHRWEADRNLLRNPQENCLYVGHRFERPREVSKRASEALADVRRDGLYVMDCT